MNVLFGGVLEGAIIGGLAGLIVAVFAVLLGPKRVCPGCAKKMPTPMLRPLKNCPHCGCELSPPGKKK